MPLSNDFTNTRLSYLQDAIKNTKIVTEQFYPRFVREYNEQFPFTEPSLSSIGNPISNTGIKGYLQPKTKNQVIEDLKTKITALTNDEGITNKIGIALSNQLSFPVLSYFNDNFDSINKKIPIPRDGISKETYVNKVLSVLRSDAYKNDVSVLDDTSPPINPIRQTVLQSNTNPNPNPNLNLNVNPTIQAVNAQLVNKPGSKRGIPNEKNIKLNITTEDEYRAEYNLINSKMKAGIIPDDFDIWLVNYQNAQTRKELKMASLNRKATPPRATIPTLPFPITNNPLRKTIKPRQRATTPTLPRTKITTSGQRAITPILRGIGIQLKPLRIQHRVIKHKQVFNNNKYAIDTKKLKKNILDLKYVKNANHVATFQPIEISNHLKTIIDNIIKDHYNLQTETFDDLNTTEKRILKRLFKFLKIHNLSLETNSNENDSIQHNFEVAYGSFLAGNDNKELIKELTQYVKLAVHENTISKKDGYEILKKLNNK